MNLTRINVEGSAAVVKMEIRKALSDSIRSGDVTHLPDISTHNRNYFKTEGYLLFGVSNNDDFTYWYWVLGDEVRPIGCSYYKILVDKTYT